MRKQPEPGGRETDIVDVWPRLDRLLDTALHARWVALPEDKQGAADNA